MSETGGIATTTHDGFTISSNEEKAEDIKANLESEPAPKDGSPEEAEKAKDKEAREKRSKAAAELGKAGGKAAAEAREKAADETPPEETEETEPKPGHPRHDARARIQQLARERAEERARRQELEARLARLEAERAPQPEPAKPGPPGADRPTPDKFETYEDYVDALTEYKMEQRIKKMQDEAQEYQRQQAHVQNVLKRVESFNERITKATESDPELLNRLDTRLLDLQPTFTLPPGQPVTAANDMAQAIVESEHTAHLLTYFSEHEDEVRRILSLPDTFAVNRAIGAIEMRLTGEQTDRATSPEQAVSRAKPPVRPVTPSAGPSEEDLDAETADFDNWVRVRNAQDERRRRGR